MIEIKVIDQNFAKIFPYMVIKIGIKIEINFQAVWKLELEIILRIEIEIGWKLKSMYIIEIEIERGIILEVKLWTQELLWQGAQAPGKPGKHLEFDLTWKTSGKHLKFDS